MIGNYSEWLMNFVWCHHSNHAVAEPLQGPEHLLIEVNCQRIAFQTNAFINTMKSNGVNHRTELYDARRYFLKVSRVRTTYHEEGCSYNI